MEVNRLYPEFLVSNLEKSTKFYCDILGFATEFARPEERFVFLSFQGAQILGLLKNSNFSTNSLRSFYFCLLRRQK
jgi:catechol 2,3-dioxygenase-like lactoylglutathione lyase family enzyme